jgi:hypothetical protein
MKQATFCLSLFIILIYSSCKKDTQNSNINPTTTKVASSIMTDVSNTGRFTEYKTYEYDAEGRVIFANGEIYQENYSYSGSTVVRIRLPHILGYTYDTIIYALNAQGLATSDNKGGIYTYDGNGYLLRAINYDPALGQMDTQVFVMANSNIISSNILNISNSLITYSFSPQKDNRDFGLNFLGKHNTNLISSSIQGSKSNHYTYQTDDQGRVTEELQNMPSETITTSYSY